MSVWAKPGDTAGAAAANAESRIGGLLEGLARSIVKCMDSGYTAIVKRDGEWWIGWVEEVPGVNAQERSKEELLVSLREALKDILELNREDARKVAISNYEEVPLPA